jgi:hypothetical protein
MPYYIYAFRIKCLREVIMLRSVDELTGYKLLSKDGEIGKVKDFFFDDYTWTIRYMVADTGNWLSGRTVLISTYSLEKPDLSAEHFPVNLTKKQIENSPDVDTQMPVEKHNEAELTKYYGWPDYWTGLGSTVLGSIPSMAYPGEVPVPLSGEKDRQDTHLHSARAIINLGIEGTDDSLGHVEDFIIDDTKWSIKYLIVDTRNWLPGGKKVILSPHWIKKMDWMDAKVYIDLTKEQIKNSPEWDSSAPPHRDYEEKLYNHYEKKTYW